MINIFRGLSGTEIINDGASLRIVKPEGVILVNKLHVKTIDTIKDEIVRLNIGEGALKNIYIKFADVVNPYGLENAAQLRDEINNMLLSTLNDIKTAISNIQCSCNASGQIIRIDESIPLITYYGYATTGSMPNQAAWSIKKITRDAATDIVTTQWADGNELFDNIWDARYSLIYAALTIP